jgi:hypothetical protein
MAGANVECMWSPSDQSGYTQHAMSRATGSINDGQWHHIVFVFPGGTAIQGYVDGVSRPLTASALSRAAVGSTTRPFKIGTAQLVGNYLTGSLDEVALYATALDAAAVAAHMTASTEAAASGAAGVPGWLMGEEFMASRYNVYKPITPSDTVDLPVPTDAILVGAAGTVAAVMESGQVAVLTLPAGAWVPIAARRINATGTSATALVALNDV